MYNTVSKNVVRKQKQGKMIKVNCQVPKPTL